MKTSLIAVTPEAEKTMLHCARVSNPANQNSESTKLLDYCIRHGHWSVFEMAHMTVEIETSRAIAAQILRHRSFSFQEFSQRYADVTTLFVNRIGEESPFESYPARSQDTKNRQNSIDDMSEEDKDWFQLAQQTVQDNCMSLYKEAIQRGIAKEQARFLLPMSVKTRMYMTGSIRSWLHYLDLRCGNGTQKEHKEIADQIKAIFVEQFPNIARAKGWDNSETPK